MKIDDITEGWWDFLRGYYDPKGYKSMGKNLKGSADDYLQRELQNLRQQGQAVDNLEMDPSKIHPATWKAIDQAMDRPYDPTAWAKRQEKYLRAKEPQQTQQAQQTQSQQQSQPATNQYGVMTAQATPGKPKMATSGQATASWSGSGQQPYSTTLSNVNTTPAPEKQAKPRQSVRATSNPAPVDTSSMSPEELRKYYNKQFQSGVKVAANRG